VADTIARLLANGLQTRLGQTIIVENRPGAGGNVAAGVVARSHPDGYTLLLTTTAFAINLTLNKSGQFTSDDFTAIAFPASSPEVLAVNSNTKIQTLSDLVNSGKEKSLNFGTAGFGSASHIMAEYFFKNVAKVQAVHIPFQGGAPAINALLGAQIDVLAAILGGPVAAQINSGGLRGLAVASDRRVPVAPNVPTFAEAGYPGMQFSDWVGLFAPGKTDPEFIKKLGAATEEALKDPELVAKVNAMGFDPATENSAGAQHYFVTEVERWTKLIKSLGLSY
jgi:tripartite-type tricarboxylate transporter receptor subunit TctC